MNLLIAFRRRVKREKRSPEIKKEVNYEERDNGDLPKDIEILSVIRDIYLYYLVAELAYFPPVINLCIQSSHRIDHREIVV